MQLRGTLLFGDFDGVLISTLRNLCVLCDSAVIVFIGLFTAETQRTQRLRREDFNFKTPTEVLIDFSELGRVLCCMKYRWVAKANDWSTMRPR